MKKNKPLILVVNDDGIVSPGIKFLIEVMEKIGHVFVVAPSLNRSGASHSMTLSTDIFIKKMNNQDNYFICSGTPVDCVKVAVSKLLPKLPDLCVSGINHGSNHSINSLYSGTLHAAMEANIKGVPAISFSHLNYSENINFDDLEDIITSISQKVLDYGLPKSLTLNINFPDVPFANMKGVRVCKQASGYWDEEFVKTQNKQSKIFYSIRGQFICDNTEKNTDAWALKNNFISIVPVSFNSDLPLDINAINYLVNDF